MSSGRTAQSLAIWQGYPFVQPDVLRCGCAGHHFILARLRHSGARRLTETLGGLKTHPEEEVVAHLTDMEELLAGIPQVDIRDYMREAMNCYMAGAYRGSLVLSYIALFDDLLMKLGELANVNATAKKIFLEASKKKGDQDIYESYLIDQLTSKSLISGLDSSFLTTLQTLRNKSAHPSGHRPSAEEARFIFFEVVDRFLSKPILSTTHLVDDLITRLKNTNFFPRMSISEIGNVVRDELATLHEEAIPQLVVKMSLAVTSTDSVTKKNAGVFLIGLATIDNPPANQALQGKLISVKADDSTYHDVLMQVISANGKLVSGLNGTTVVRLRAIIATKIAKVTSALSETNPSHPTQALSSIAAAIPEVDFVTTYKPELQALFERRAHSEFVVNLVTEKPSLRPIYIPILLAKAGSADFATANSFSNGVDKIDGALSTLLTEEQALHLVVVIIKAATWGAWAAKAVVSAKFAGTPSLRTKALSFIARDEAAAMAYIEETLGESKPVSEFIAANLTDEEPA